jgi:hypothetical protein
MLPTLKCYLSPIYALYVVTRYDYISTRTSVISRDRFAWHFINVYNNTNDRIIVRVKINSCITLNRINRIIMINLLKNKKVSCLLEISDINFICTLQYIFE